MSSAIQKMYECTIPECTLQVKLGSRLKICSLCRSSISRWSHRRPAEVLERRRKLHMYDHRMGELVKPKWSK